VSASVERKSGIVDADQRFALLALDHPRKAVAMQARLDEARRHGGTICIPAEVIAQAWRSSRQARLGAPAATAAVRTQGRKFP